MSLHLRKTLFPLLQQHILLCRSSTAHASTTNLLLSHTLHDQLHSQLNGQQKKDEGRRGIFTSAVPQRRGGKKKPSQKLKGEALGNVPTTAGATTDAQQDASNTVQDKVDKKRKRAQRWTYTHFDTVTENHQKASKPTQAQSASVKSNKFGIDVEALPELPHFAALIAMESARLRGDKKLSPVLNREYKYHIGDMLKEFCYSGTASDKALELYINAELWPQASARFRRFVLRSLTIELRDHLLAHDDYSSQVEEILFPYFAPYAFHEFSPEINAYRDVVQAVDLRRPYEWYRVARSLQRRVVYHAGPTNSGKTYNALQAFKAAEKGVYCGPLRLLAMEVYDSTNADGVLCNLVTGQEKREVPGANHVSCTVEMISCSQRADVCVIDEIQLLGDESRGQGWTRALQGVPANEIHVCGDLSALPLVRQLCRQMGEALEVKQYERFTPLEVDEYGLPEGYKDVQPGDCIVAFSRREIFDIKKIIEEESGHKTCVVYGALPPETRRQQARLFNEPDSGYDVLVASDAVGMGLNLNIKRIVFHTVEKFEGLKKAVITPSQIKQIAGRAGRRNSIYPAGYVTCYDPSHMDIMRDALALPQSSLSTPAAGLFPEFELIEMFASKIPGGDMCHLLHKLMTEAKLDGMYFFCKQESLMIVARMLQAVPELSLRDRFTFAMSPVNVRDPRVLSALLEFATVYGRGYPVCCKLDVPKRVPTTDDELKHLETLHQVASLWLWLSFRFKERFPGQATAQVALAKIIALMDLGLENLSKINEGEDARELGSGKRLDFRELVRKAIAWNSHLTIESPTALTVRMRVPLGLTMGRRPGEIFVT